MPKDLDEQVAAFRTRPLHDGPYTFLAADTLMMKVREGGRVVKTTLARHKSSSSVFMRVPGTSAGFGKMAVQQTR